MPLSNFYPRPPGGGRRAAAYYVAKYISFLSTPSGWRATCPDVRRDRRLLFLSTPSGWRATEAWRKFCCSSPNFYPRPPGGGRPLTALEDSGVTDISIHALQVEGDNIAKFDGSFYTAISIHALRVEGDRRRFCLSTRHPHHFYPRPPGGGRLGGGWSNLVGGNISIHALRVEGDRTKEGQDVESFRISIHALRVEGDLQSFSGRAVSGISIHALRVEGDRHRGLLRYTARRFLSTPSGWRATVKAPLNGIIGLLFLSTPSGWRATIDTEQCYQILYISIHALRVEGDRRPARFPRRLSNFYPRPPGGGRQGYRRRQQRPAHFYPRPPGGGRPSFQFRHKRV